MRKREIREKLIGCEGGSALADAAEPAPAVADDDEQSSDGELSDETLLCYAATSLWQWKEDPKANSELPLFSLFMILNDGETDLMASWEEVEVIINYVEPLRNE